MKKKSWLNKTLSTKAIVGIVLGLIVIIGAGTGGYYYQSKKLDKSAPAPSTTVSTTMPTSTSPSALTNKIIDKGITWLNPPQKLNDLGIYKASSPEATDYKETQYYKIATTANKQDIILARVVLEGLGNYYKYFRFVKTEANYQLILQNSDDLEEDMPFSKAVDYATDSSFVLNSLLPDSTITENNTYLINSNATGGRELDFNSDTIGTKIYSTKWGDLYYYTKAIKDTSLVKIAQYYLLLNDTTKIVYEPQPIFFKDDGTFDVSWDNNSLAKQNYAKMRTGGCGLFGGAFPVASDLTTLKSKIEIGSTSNSGKLYTIQDKANPYIEYGYQFYKSASQALDNSETNKTIEQFVADSAMIFWTDDLNQTVIFLNNKYAPATECGKPVIYLYPQKDTFVKVNVGAQITKSEPTYDNGWNGIAHSDGTITIENQKYPYLFWEGLGFGSYPDIKTGTVVKAQLVQNTMVKQMKYMGLNDKEIADFLEFWMPKMPDAKYIRLTWLTNDEMNKLAPLKITPKPQSTIRIFLDFEGLDSYKAIAPQILPQYQRNGFTLVEWGGLLKKNN